jgi:hypothetical protein
MNTFADDYRQVERREVEGREVTLTTLPRRRTWGGWYQHTLVAVGDETIGRVQRRQRPGGCEATTHHQPQGRPATAVLGMDLGWLLRVSGRSI